MLLCDSYKNLKLLFGKMAIVLISLLLYACSASDENNGVIAHQSNVQNISDKENPPDPEISEAVNNESGLEIGDDYMDFPMKYTNYEKVELDYDIDQMEPADIEGVNAIFDDGEVMHCLCDIDGDDLYDDIQVWWGTLPGNNIAGMGVLRVLSHEGVCIYEKDMGYSRAGRINFYLCPLAGEVYLLEYYPPEVQQSNYYYSCKVFRFDAGGEVVYEKIEGTDANGIDAFLEDSRKYMDHSVLLVSTWTGALQAYSVNE